MGTSRGGEDLKKEKSSIPATVCEDPPTVAERELFESVREILDSARGRAYAAANSAMVEAYWNIGRLIVEKQGGEERAAYGDGLIKGLSEKLTAEYGKGFTITNLKCMRQFYSVFPKGHALRDQLSWTHYRLVIWVKDERARQFYLEECTKGNWSTRQLERQINSFCYERLLASRDNTGIVEEIIQKEPGGTPEDEIKDPYLLGFLGLDPNSKHYESDLEQGLMDHLQQFLLELGRGFTFEARQKLISLDGDFFYIDLVFYVRQESWIEDCRKTTTFVRCNPNGTCVAG